MAERLSSLLFNCLKILNPFTSNGIGLDKCGYQVNSLCISQRKHMLWLLIRRMVSLYFYYVVWKFLFFNANNVDPDQTPHFVASELRSSLFVASSPITQSF